MNTLQAIILAIIEGLTEFLPVSSTGHMIIASSFFGIAQDDFTKLFTILILQKSEYKHIVKAVPLMDDEGGLQMGKILACTPIQVQVMYFVHFI